MRTSLCLLVIALLATEVQGRDIFVNNLSGNDALTGRAAVSAGRAGGPVLTIAKAMRLAELGDRIVLANTGEPYREQVSLQAKRSLTFDGNGAVIDGSIAVPDEAWELLGNDIFRFTPQIKSHQSLFIDGEAVANVPAKRGEPLPKLEPMQWCLLDGMIYLRVRPGELPQQYHASCAGMWTGITIYDVRDVVVQNVVIRGFAFDGVNAHDNDFNVRMESVIARDNGRSGISIGGASRVRLVGCEAGGNHIAQLRSEGYCHVSHIECKFDDATAPAIESAGGEIEQE